MSFKEKTAVVTGGTGALGKVVVQQFLDMGSNIAVPVHTERQLVTLPQHVGRRLFGSVADLTKEDKVDAFVDQVRKRFGTVDYLVNIAGGYAGGSFIEEVSVQEWEKMMDMNLRSAFLICRACLRLMRPQKFGRIVNIAAMPALSSGARKGPYAISKRGVIALTETVADEVKGGGITVNAIAPSIILSEANKQSMPDADFSKWVTPEEIARLIVFLCLEEMGSLSGNTIKMYGGV